MNKTKKTMLIVLCVLMVLGIGTLGILYKMYKDQHPFMMEIKDKVKILLCDIKIDKLSDEYEGVTPGKTVFEDETKKLIETDKGLRLIHYGSGYYMDLPEGSTADLSHSPYYVKISAPNYDVTVSREYSTEDDVRYFTGHYIDRFLLNEGYRESNDIELLAEKTDNGTYDSFSARILGYEDGHDGYTYINIYTGTKIFYRLTFKFDGDEYDAVKSQIDDAVSGFKYFRPKNADKDETSVEYNLVQDTGLSEEAKNVFEKINGTNDIYWGIFTKDIYTTGIDETIPKYEEDLDYNFSVILSYLHFGHEFPTEFAEKCYDDGKILELTYQVTTSNNENLFGYTPQLDIYRGKLDDEIRAFARELAEFGHPVLFRLGNEMNSDWTSYSGVVNMSDPEIYVAVWQRIFNIFREEGANNALWIYNPNDRAYPPCGWNNFMAYYPGDEYVHLIGITGYNNGTYYAQQNNEKWREFDVIYDEIENEYMPYFSEFPWIITEFASSSIGGDKAGWIENMFEEIGDYDNIKIAVWFDYADFDPAYEGTSVVSRPYWLCETEEITDAVRKGLTGQKAMTWHE